jgi:hypothetical protein
MVLGLYRCQKLNTRESWDGIFGERLSRLLEARR